MDDNRVIIDNVNFNRNLPKWATDDTLSRIEKMVGRSHKESQKSLTDVVRTLKTISSKDADLFKETQSSNKAIKKELTKLTKILSQNNNRNTTTTSNNDQVAISKKTNVTLDKGFKSLDNSLDDVIDTILSGNNETSIHLKKANDASEKVSEQLIKIYDELRNIGNGSSNNSSSNPNPNNSSNNQNNRQTDTTNVLLGDIKQILSKQNTLQNEMYRRSMSDEDFQRIMENNARRSGEEYRDASEHTMGSLSSMLSNAISRVDRGDENSLGQRALTGTLSTLATTIGTLASMLKMTPLGRMATLAMASYTAANKMFEYAYDVQSDFRGLIDRGFNFSELSQEVSPDRLDGISMRRSILRNDIGLETATQILEKNTRLLNEVGFSAMFGELGNIVGNIDDPNSVTNRLGMTRDQVALIATDFYAMHRRINNITTEFTAIERQNLASQFVENVRRMSQQLGVGVPQIREAIEQFTNTETFSRTAAFLDEAESQNVAMFNAMLANLDGMSPRIQEVLTTAATSVAGIFDPSNMDIIGSNPLAIEALSQFDERLRNVRNMDVGQQTELTRDIVNELINVLDRNGGRDVQALSIDPTLRQSINELSTVRGSIQQLSQTPTDLLMGGREDVSPLAAAARELENMGILIDARTEEMFASAADSAIGREALANVLSVDEIMKRSQLAILDLTKDVVSGLFDGPIPTILRNIQRFFEKVADAAGWLVGKRHTGEFTGATADNIIRSIQDNVLGQEAFNYLFEATEVEGQTVYNIQEGIKSEDLNSFFSELYQNASSREDRDAIAGIVRNMSRGLEGEDSRISDDARHMMGSIEESFLGMASSMVSGDERENLLDAYTGFQNSANLLGERLLDNSYDTSNERTFFNMRLTGDNIGRLQSTVEALDNVEIIDSDLVGSMESLQGKMQFNLSQERMARFRERQRTGQVIDSDVLNTIVDMFGDNTPEDTTNIINDLTQTLERNNRNLDIEWMRNLTNQINQPDDELSQPNISPQSIDNLTQTLERNNRNLDVEWMDRLMSQVNTSSQPEEPIVSDYQDTPTPQRNQNPPVSATIEQYKPIRWNENIDQQGILQELRKQEEQRQYTEQVRQAGENSFNQFTQNTQQNETINNNQDNTDISQALAEISSTQQRLAEGIDRNSRAIERYLATKT